MSYTKDILLCNQVLKIARKLKNNGLGQVTFVPIVENKGVELC